MTNEELLALADANIRGGPDTVVLLDPTVVKALVEEVLTLRGKVERVEALADEWEAECDPIGGCTAERHHRRVRAALGDDQ